MDRVNVKYVLLVGAVYIHLSVGSTSYEATNVFSHRYLWIAST